VEQGVETSRFARPSCGVGRRSAGEGQAQLFRMRDARARAVVLRQKRPSVERSAVGGLGGGIGHLRYLLAEPSDSLRVGVKDKKTGGRVAASVVGPSKQGATSRRVARE
jgi:hypothetical protein